MKHAVPSLFHPRTVMPYCDTAQSIRHLLLEGPWSRARLRANRVMVAESRLPTAGAHSDGARRSACCAAWPSPRKHTSSCCVETWEPPQREVEARRHTKSSMTCFCSHTTVRNCNLVTNAPWGALTSLTSGNAPFSTKWWPADID